MWLHFSLKRCSLWTTHNIHSNEWWGIFGLSMTHFRRVLFICIQLINGPHSWLFCKCYLQNSNFIFSYSETLTKIMMETNQNNHICTCFDDYRYPNSLRSIMECASSNPSQSACLWMSIKFRKSNDYHSNAFDWPSNIPIYI